MTGGWNAIGEGRTRKGGRERQQKRDRGQTWKRGRGRRAFLVGAGGVLASLAGCVSAPSGGGVPFEALEIDDGPVYGPGLQTEVEQAFYAALVENETEAAEFDLASPVVAEARAFVEETDFSRELLGVVQVSGLNSSMYFEIAEVVRTSAAVVVVVGVRDEPPYSEDRVISTLLVRVPRERGQQPSRIWVELGFEHRSETFSGT